MAKQIISKVVDKKTGELYNPEEKFWEMLKDPKIIAVLKRMKDK